MVERIIFGRTKWQSETTEYAARIANLNIVTKEVVAKLEGFPGLLWFNPPPLVSVQHRAIIYSNQLMNSGVEALRSVQLLWPEGHFLCGGHCIRLMHEVWGGFAYLRRKILKRAQRSDEDARAADDKLQKLLLGTNSGPSLPAGIPGRLDVININEFIRAGDASGPGFQSQYDFLCDISHPTFMHMFLNWITVDAGWSNDLWAKEVHTILERITKAAEDSVAGISAEVCAVYDECVPGVEASKNENAATRPSR